MLESSGLWRAPVAGNMELTHSKAMLPIQKAEKGLQTCTLKQNREECLAAAVLNTSCST